MRKVALSEVKDDLPKYLRLAENEGIIITRNGKPAWILLGFGADDALDDGLENDPRFLRRIAAARASVRAGEAIRLEDIE